MTKKRKPGPKRPSQELWLYGKHACLAALSNPNRTCLKFLATKNALQSLDGMTFAVTPQISDGLTIARLLPEDAVHQGMALQVKPLPETTIESVLSRNPLVVLDQVTDPHNVGAILRSAAAFNAGAVIVTKDHAPEESGTLAKSASGALEVVPLIRVTNLSRTLETLKQHGYWCLGLDGYADTLLHKIDTSSKTVLVMGAEGKGLRRLTRDNCDILAKLPISRDIESLNVSNAAAIALYQLSLSS